MLGKWLIIYARGISAELRNTTLLAYLTDASQMNPCTIQL